jgi:transcriptional regulator with XRE-family HTH domain
MEDNMSQGTTWNDYPPEQPALFDSVFPRRLKAVRVEAGTTQQQLAERMTAAGCKMHRSTIAKIELGERPVSIGEAVQFTEVLGVKLSEMLRIAIEDPDADLRAYSARIRIRALEHELADRQKAIQDAQALHADTLRRLEEARKELSGLEGGQ